MKCSCSIKGGLSNKMALSLSHASPFASPSQFSCPGLKVSRQLSSMFGTPSLSGSAQAGEPLSVHSQSGRLGSQSAVAFADHEPSCALDSSFATQPNNVTSAEITKYIRIIDRSLACNS